MIKILTIIGARPQIIKAAALSRAIIEHFPGKIHEVILHTGQHYDHNMSDAFIEELGVPKPQYHLETGSSGNGHQTAMMISGIEKVLLKEQPDWCVLFGDTNSTLAGAVAAAKVHIPIAHIEAGLRSYDKTMPEELNRIACDHFSTLLFAPTRTAIKNLELEGFRSDNTAPFSINKPAIIHSGDIMFDNTLFLSDIAVTKNEIIKKLDIGNKKFALCTIHRQNNTDNPHRLTEIFQSFAELAVETDLQFIIPLHPRTLKMIQLLPDNHLLNSLNENNSIRIIEPVSFLEMMVLEANASIILTDSGGVQKEAYFMKKPCVVLRKETEWVEIIEQQTGALADADKNKIKYSVKRFLNNPPDSFPKLFGNGRSAIQICNSLIDCTSIF